MTTFDLEELESGGERVRLVEISGELDLTNARDLGATLDELSEEAGILVLDLNRVVFIDSAAVHVLFRTALSLGRDRFGVVLGPTSAIARTLEIVGLAQLVELRATTEELLTALSSASA